MAFWILPCWTYFSALLRTFCLLNPNNAIRVRTPDPVLIQNPLNVGETDPRYRSQGHLTYRQMDLPDKANCTSGRHEPHGYQGLPKEPGRQRYFASSRKSTE